MTEPLTGKTYADAGVDLDAAASVKNTIKDIASATLNSAVIAGPGGFGGVIDPDPAGDTLLVASTDGVGTKLRIADALGRHDTVGASIVNHCINDILPAGARPLFFLDYIGLSRFNAGKIAEIVSGLDILIVRELTGGIYFGEPRGIRVLENGEREGFNTYKYSESEIVRIGKLAFEAARVRSRRVCSVDKANVLEATILWREVMQALASDYPDVELSHMYVDNAAMQLIKAPKQFDVIVTGNMFGDILSDAAAMLTGSIGMLPSASLDRNGKGLYEPCHGSAPDITGLGIANPLATILSAAMMLRYSLQAPEAAVAIEQAVSTVLDNGLRTSDIYTEGTRKVSTAEMGDAVVTAL